MTRYGFLSTFPPTRCGLATFTQALADALAAGTDDECVVVRVDDGVPAGPATGSARVRVPAVLRPGDAAGTDQAVAVLDDCDVVIVQHEYGIYGGPDGDEVVDLMSRLGRPVVVVVHTVLPEPTEHQREVLVAVTDLATAVVAMTASARHLLTEHYAVPASKVHLIPHGVDTWTAGITAHPAHRRPVVLTWGLIGPGKGIEWGIRALAELRDLDPGPRYRILGQTHPKVLLTHGEAYRSWLVALSEELGVGDDVELDDRYRDSAELAVAVGDADIVLLPYDSRDQATSGVLAEAGAAGKVIIATRFPHAVELLTGGTGMLVDHERPEQIADAIRLLLARGDRAADDPPPTPRTAATEQDWSHVAARYRTLVGAPTTVDGPTR